MLKIYLNGNLGPTPEPLTKSERLAVVANLVSKGWRVVERSETEIYLQK